MENRSHSNWITKVRRTLRNLEVRCKQCVERIINGIVEQFRNIQEKTEGLAPFEKLEHLGNMTLDFPFEHYAASRISVLPICGRQKAMTIPTELMQRICLNLKAKNLMPDCSCAANVSAA